MANNSTEAFDQYLHTADTTHRIIESIIMCIIFAIGAVGNPLTACVVIRNKKLHNLHNSLTMNIIFVDSLATFTIMPIQIYMFIMGRWPFSASVCKLMGFLIILFSTCALWTILWLSILRSLHIFRTAKYLAIVRPRCIISITASTWSMALICCCTLLGLDKLKYKARFNVCFFLFDSPAQMMAFMIPFVVIPILITSVLSVMIFKGLKQRERNTGIQPQQREEEKGLAYTYLMLVLVYDLCYFPVFVIETESIIFKNQELPHVIYMIVTYFGYLPFSIKAIAYMMTKKSTREAVFSLFKRKNAVKPSTNRQTFEMGRKNDPQKKEVAQHNMVDMLQDAEKITVV